VQVTPIQHEAVDGVSVEFVVDEIPAFVVDRQFPELGNRWHVVEPERHRVFRRANKRPALRVGKTESTRMRDWRADGGQSVVTLPDVVVNVLKKLIVALPAVAVDIAAWSDQ